MSDQKRRKRWSKMAMVGAVNAVNNGKMGYHKASKIFNVPKTTLRNYIKSNKSVEEMISVPLGRRPALTEDSEKELVSYCLEIEKRFFGLRSSDVKRLAFELAMHNGLKHPFTAEKGYAGTKWLKGFMGRHPELTIRKPQGARGFTRENVKQFFNTLESLFPKIKNNPSRLFNVDETGFTFVQHKTTKILSLKGKNQVGSLGSAQRDALVTIVTSMSASGIFVPPLLVFPRKNMKFELLNGAPPGSVAKCHPSGWIQQDTYIFWLRHFIDFVKPSPEDPVILILDGHYSHTRNLDLIKVARENYVHILCLPPHSTDKLQPLDVAFMAPFKSYYEFEVETWLKNNPGSIVTSCQTGELIGKAYLRAANCEVAVNGFRKCGIYPFSPNIFRDEDFAIHVQPEISFEEVNVQSSHLLSSFKKEPSDNELASENDLTPGCSKEVNRRSAVLETSKLVNVERQQSKNEDKFKKTGAAKKRKPNRKDEGSSSEESDDGSLILDDSDSEVDDPDVECFYCTNLYSEDTRCEQWIRCQKCCLWCHEECAGAEGKDFVCDYCK